MTKKDAISRIQQALSVPNRLQGLVLIDEESANMAIEALQDRPTGVWIHEKMPVPPYYFTPSCHCNQCGVFVVQESNYCPYCGADMRGNIK